MAKDTHSTSAGTPRWVKILLGLSLALNLLSVGAVAGTFWRVMAENKVKSFFTAPTAFT